MGKKEDHGPKEAVYLLDFLEQALHKIQASTDHGSGEYKAFLHGQVYGIAMALRVLFPGPGNWGEKAALRIRPVLTEHRCICEDEKE